MTSADLYLRKGADRRLRGGHLWIYSNEIDSKRSSLGSFAPGEPVCVRSAEGKLLGSAYMEPQSLICARMFAPGEQRSLDFSLILQRLKVALAGRDAFFDQPFYRLVYGDSDLLPGIVIDRFGPYLVVQLNNAGWNVTGNLCWMPWWTCSSPRACCCVAIAVAVVRAVWR